MATFSKTPVKKETSVEFSSAFEQAGTATESTTVCPSNQLTMSLKYENIKTMGIKEMTRSKKAGLGMEESQG